MLTPDMLIIYFIMTLLIGYGIGFFTVKINHGLVILSHLNSNDNKDHFQEFFNLLHGVKHSWTNELEEKMKKEQKKIKFRHGQGYLIHDRVWLHGRMTTTGTVKPNRLHRLSFNTTTSR